MKKIVLFLAAALVIAACNKKDEPENPATQNENIEPEIPAGETTNALDSATYFEASGTNTVPNVEGESHNLPYIKTGVRAEAILRTDSTLDLILYGISFSSKMPLTIDMTIPGASYTRSAGIINISGDSIAPTMGERPFDRYLVTALKGTITADSIIFSNNYGTYQDCSYAGKVTKMEVRK